MAEIKSYGVILFRRNGGKVEYLLLKNAKWGHWDFAKGHPDTGEDETAAAMRETREESGLTEIRLVSGFRESIFYRVDIKGKRAEKGMKEAVYFLGEASPADEVRLSHEHMDFVWLPVDKALAKIQYANQRDLLARADAFLAASRS